jgi:hypothetical protein
MLYFSFSLYGGNPKYTHGMLANVEHLSNRYPTARVAIYIADDVPQHIVDKLSAYTSVHLIHTPRREGSIGMFDRFLTIDMPDCSVMIVRDADSRVHERDAACIDDFLESDKLLHIIRDHPYHGVRILGGLWAIKKEAFQRMGLPIIGDILKEWLPIHVRPGMGCDQDFLGDQIYPRLRHVALIYDRCTLYHDETHTPFRVPIIDRLFCGQVHLFREDGTEYTEFNP